MHQPVARLDHRRDISRCRCIRACTSQSRTFFVSFVRDGSALRLPHIQHDFADGMPFLAQQVGLRRVCDLNLNKSYPGEYVQSGGKSILPH